MKKGEEVLRERARELRERAGYRRYDAGSASERARWLNGLADNDDAQAAELEASATLLEKNTKEVQP